MTTQTNKLLSQTKTAAVYQNMSNLSGYDAEAIGFDSITQNKKSDASSSTQTSEFSESGVSTQTNMSKDCGSMTTSDLNAGDDILKEYPPPGLNEFLKRVVPSMLEQLDLNDKEFLYNSSDSDEEESLEAKLFQELKAQTDMNGSGDQSTSVLSLSWSSAGNTLAVSIGQKYHENWCEHTGLVRIYTLKRGKEDKLVHSYDISENICVSVVKYHPAVAALLAYGTVSGEVVISNLNSMDVHMSSPSGCHGSKRVSSLLWTDASLTNSFLMMNIVVNKARRGASDQVLISSGCDGTLNAWQVNTNSSLFRNIICYQVNGSKNIEVDITCFDFIKCQPLRPSDEKVPDDIFVVGTKSGTLFLCKMKSYVPIVESSAVDPVYEVLEGHSTCVLDVVFSYQKPGVFASISIDSELRIYDVNQLSPIKVVCIDVPLTCMAWVGSGPLVIVGVAGEGELVRVYQLPAAKQVNVRGFTGDGSVSAIAVTNAGMCRIAAGDGDSTIRVWDLPIRRMKTMPDDLEF